MVTALLPVCVSEINITRNSIGSNFFRLAILIDLPLKVLFLKSIKYGTSKVNLKKLDGLRNLLVLNQNQKQAEKLFCLCQISSNSWHESVFRRQSFHQRSLTRSDYGNWSVTALNSWRASYTTSFCRRMTLSC